MKEGRGTPSPCVLDTNVAVAADGRATVGAACVRACVRALRDIMATGHLVLDDEWRVIGEYRDNLHRSGQPGPGLAFLKWVLTNHHNPRRCTRVRLNAKPEDPENFVEFPSDAALAEFDPSDRKFVAVAAAHGDRPTILEACDSKWWGWKDALAACGITVEFLCEEEISAAYRRKKRSR